MKKSEILNTLTEKDCEIVSYWKSSIMELNVVAKYITVHDLVELDSAGYVITLKGTKDGNAKLIFSGDIEWD